MLIDVGLPEKKIASRLIEIGEKIEDISAVCITHEHTDHIKSLEVLAKKYDIDVFVHEKLAGDKSFSFEFKEGKLHTFLDKQFSVGEFEVVPFDVSHDAVAPVGFVVRVAGSKSKVGFVTDTGIVLESMKNSLSGSKIVFIESNYDETMLWEGRYPEVVKQRINGKFGHLSNAQSLELAKFLFEHGTKCFVLSHLSENNNKPEIAFMNYVNFFEQQGYVLDKDVFVRLSFQNKHGNNFVLKEEF
jgi:phosphoribosyl 1,2-cyclic phosphodiesterase